VTAGLTYQFKVAARNNVGLSSYSTISIIAATVPSVPLSAARDDANTDADQVGLTWSVPTSDGGSPILDYTIDWDSGSGTWTTSASNVIGLSYIKTGLTPGVTYQFKISARNAVGLSVQTSSISIIAAAVPAKPAAPTTALDGGSTNVIISWTLPYNGGSPITSYKIFI
jgi:Fibronectin type III domain